MFNPYSSFYDGMGFNPFLHSSSFPNQSGSRQPQQNQRSRADQRDAQARARALGEQRARRAQWLPDEDEDPEDDWEYDQLGPRERLYLEAKKRQQQIENQRRAEAEARAAREREAEEQRWQQQLQQRQKEEDERREKMLAEKRRVQQQKQQKREEARRKAEAEQEEQTEEQSQTQPPQKQAPDGDVPITFDRSASAQDIHSEAAPPNQPPEPQQQSGTPPPTHEYDEVHEQAASRIQTRYRTHQSFKTIRDLEKQFKSLKKNFVLPTVLDFQMPGSEKGHIAVTVQHPEPPEGDESAPIEVDGQTVGKLAYNATNYPVHAYVEALLKLQTRLDEVESWGSKQVRNRRRGVVKVIEKELGRVERYWQTAWRDYLEQKS